MLIGKWRRGDLSIYLRLNGLASGDVSPLACSLALTLACVETALSGYDLGIGGDLARATRLGEWFITQRGHMLPVTILEEIAINRRAFRFDVDVIALTADGAARHIAHILMGARTGAEDGAAHKAHAATGGADHARAATLATGMGGAGEAMGGLRAGVTVEHLVVIGAAVAVAGVTFHAAIIGQLGAIGLTIPFWNDSERVRRGWPGSAARSR